MKNQVLFSFYFLLFLFFNNICVADEFIDSYFFLKGPDKFFEIDLDLACRTVIERGLVQVHNFELPASLDLPILQCYKGAACLKEFQFDRITEQWRVFYWAPVGFFTR